MNNTIEVLEELLYEAEHAYDNCVEGMKEDWGEKIDALTKAITTLKALESAADELPEKKDADWHINGSEYGRCDEYFCSDMSEGFNQAIDLFQIPYAKQILKVKGLEKSISDVLTQRDMWKTDYAELQAEVKKLKEQQLTEDEIEKVILDNKEIFIFGMGAKAIIKAREDKNG